MPLTNAEKQARWREKHVRQRRSAQRVANLLVKRSLSDDDVADLAVELREHLNSYGVALLRRMLNQVTSADMEAVTRDHHRIERDQWLRENPRRTAAEFDRLLRNTSSSVWAWRRTRSEAATAAERAAWERDHPGRPWPEHLCGLSDREYTDYVRWLRGRSRTRNRTWRTPR